MQWDAAGELGIRITLAESPSPALTRRLLTLDATLRAACADGLTDSALGYTTLTVFFDPRRIERRTLITLIENLDGHDDNEPDAAKTRNLVELPVYYSPETGADLETLAQEKQMSVEAVIACHSGRDYDAYANGFAPGFCYLGEIDQSLEAPRLSTPRRQVPAGSVAIADRQTAVYPLPSPAGWRLLGRCPLLMFDINSDPPTRINVGDTVRFSPITRAQFLELGGLL